MKHVQEELTFSRTGNFWIDNGLVALYEHLRNALDKQDRLEVLSGLTVNGFSLKLPITEATQLLQQTGEALEAKLVSETKNEGWYYESSSGKLKVYPKRDRRPHCKFFLGQITPAPDEKLLFGQAEPALQEQIQKFLKEHKQKLYGTKGNEYLPLSPMRIKIPIELDLTPGKKVCDLCRRSVKKLEELKQYQFPFLVTKGKLDTFYSHHKVSYQICSLCGLASVFALDSLLFSISGSKSKVGLFYQFYDVDLEGLLEWHKRVVEYLKPHQENPFRNFELQGYGTNYLKETLLGLLYELWEKVRGFSDEERRGLFTKRIYSFMAIGGRGTDFRGFFEYARLESAFEFFKELDKSLAVAFERIPEERRFGHTPNFRSIFSQFYTVRETARGPHDDTLVRERLAERLLNFEPIHDVIEMFLFEAQRSVWFLDEFVKFCAKEVDGMEASLLDLTQRLGGLIGAKASESEKKSVLYDIRNVKNLDEFLRTLNQIQFTFEKGGGIHVHRELLEALDESSWERYKSLVSIFAMNTYLAELYRKGKQQPKEGEGRE
jgi:hypothetical protein